jgi:hypothetical protein
MQQIKQSIFELVGRLALNASHKEHLDIWSNEVGYQVSHRDWELFLEYDEKRSDPYEVNIAWSWPPSGGRLDLTDIRIELDWIARNC